jgi:gas vesicle protein
MEEHNQEQQHTGNNVLFFLGGMFAGGLVGAVAALLLAPQSGKETRDQIQRKGIELREQAEETVEGTKAQARQITDDLREKAEELQQRGQDVLGEQRERLVTFIDNKNEEVDEPA